MNHEKSAVDRTEDQIKWLQNCSSMHQQLVRGFHYFRKYWQPTPNQVLECSHEKENP